MTNTEREQINRRFAELCGLCWHERKRINSMGEMVCTCGITFFPNGFDGHCKDNNPDFISNPTLVLVEMMKREDWPEFIVKQFTYSYTEPIRAFSEDYILDTTEGKLALAASEWMKKEAMGGTT